MNNYQDNSSQQEQHQTTIEFLSSLLSNISRALHLPLPIFLHFALAIAQLFLENYLRQAIISTQPSSNIDHTNPDVDQDGPNHEHDGSYFNEEPYFDRDSGFGGFNNDHEGSNFGQGGHNL
ncbi:10139_t:CDS:2, partial [Cetraspora pellucida]